MVSSERSGGLAIFTLDALITPPTGPTVRDYYPWQILPGREWKLRQLYRAGWVIGVVSNQDGVALGHISDCDFRNKIERLGDLLGVPLDARVCYAHPDAPSAEFRDEGGLARRLPGAAMIIELMLAHPAEMQRGTLFVGVAVEDAATAQDTGIEFMTVSEFFGELPCFGFRHTNTKRELFAPSYLLHGGKSVPTSRRTRIVIALLAATFGAFTVPFLMAMLSPPLHPVALDKNNPAYQLAASDQATIPTTAELVPYQQAVASITSHCPQLEDITVRVTQVRQALHDQASRDESALEVLQGVAGMLGPNPDASSCSGLFAQFLAITTSRQRKPSLASSSPMRLRLMCSCCCSFR